MTRPIESLKPVEVVALAIHVERANARRLRAFRDVFLGYDKEVSDRFGELAAEEDQHEAMLLARFRSSFRGEVPHVPESAVDGVLESVDLDDAEHQIFDSLKAEQVFELALHAERGAQEFYRRAAESTTDADLADLFRELGAMEDEHVGWLLRRGQPHGSGEVK